MGGDGTFLVEEFINAITTQLDRVQDALRLKAVNRPLTYALKDISLELRVFVEVDPQGNVRFRTSGPNEAGASVVHLGFTTITKPMIDENTISMAAARSAPLNELGLAPEELQRLERMGVRNLAQLNKLGSSAGVQTISRLTDVSVERLRTALVQGRPQVKVVTAVPPENRRPAVTAKPPAAQPRPQLPLTTRVPGRTVVTPPKRTAAPAAPVFSPAAPVVRVAPGTQRLNLRGVNLMGIEGEPSVRLNARDLEIRELDNDRMIVELPLELESGELEVRLPGGSVTTYQLSVGDDDDAEFAADEWAPTEEWS